MIKKVVMENLLCSGCAKKIEDEIKTIKSINNATFNFANQTMLLDVTEEYNEQEMLPKIKKIVDSIEDGVNTYLYKNKDTVKKNTNNSYNSFFIGVLVYLIAYMFRANLSSLFEVSLYIVGYIFISSKIIRKTIKGIRRKDIFNENMLMFIATLAAMFLKEYFEASLVIIFYTLGEYLQQKAVSKSKNEVKGLIDLKVDYSNVLIGNTIVIKEPEEIEVDDVIVVKNGEKIPVDGIIVEGYSSLNSSALTGESRLVDVKVNDNVLSGNINVGKVLKIKATKIYEDSTVARLIDLIENSTNHKSAPENFITKFARVYTPVVSVLALLMFMIPTLLGYKTIDENIYNAAIFLVISCPCALVLSIPLSYFAGIGAAAKEGILFKGSTYLHMLTEVDTIGIDKTGTLTNGFFSVNDYSSDEVLKIIASAERYSNHPIAKSIVEYYEGDYINFVDIEEIPGKGLSASFENNVYIIGNDELMKQHHVKYKKVRSVGTVIYLAKEKKYIGHMIITDSLKQNTVRAIKKMKKRFNITMLTGDNFEVASDVALALNSINFKSNLLPEDKITEFNNLDSKNYKMFIGDGINDSPLLKNADIGVAMGNGSEIAIDVADIIIIDDDLEKINTATKIAIRTKRIVYQNIVLSIGVKVLFLTLAGFGKTSMLEAIFADVGISLIAVLNSLRIIYGFNFIKESNRELRQATKFFKAFGNITSMSIIELLTDQEYSIEELAKELKKSTVDIYRHVEKLVKQGLVKETVINDNVVFALKDECVKDIICIAYKHLDE
ncbi:cadmium-translocating P-type ATPase [Candidatus Izimaplasma bacterium ZiA1]|uniref:heavy metal translocating P-type ATPase n=1 Tax=Candidatus Izimoplasma sp. ZiA1 TaxID=2024899 RepID=UPI000BAA6DF5|nr:cadmium-translocating P-type ATPase [Candidatus Izimaplasma bacterium ZiA1]